MLSPGGHGQEVVTESHGSRRLGEVLDDDELELLESLVPTLRLSGAGRRQEVGAVEPAHLQSVRLIRLHGVQGLVRLGGGHAGGQARPLRSTDTLRPNFVGHSAALLHAPLAEKCRRRTKGKSARTVDRTAHSSQDDEGLGQLNAVLVLVECQTPSPTDRTLGADDVGDTLDFLSVDRGDLGDLVHGILSGASLQLVNAVDPVLDELMIVLIVLEEEVDEAECESRVGLRANLQVDVAIMSADPGDAGVDRDDVRAKLHHVDEAVAEETVAVGGQRLLAPNHNPLGQRVTRVMIRTGQMTSVVELRIACAEHVVRDGATRTVAGPAGLRVAAVGGLQNGERQRVVVDASLTAGTTEANDGLGAVGVLEVTDLLADRVHCLVPSGALPLVLAAIFERALHRVDDAIRRMGVLTKSKVHGVNTTSGDRVIVVAFDTDELVALRNDLDTVSNRVRSRRRPSVATSDYGTVFKLGTPLLTICHSLLPSFSLANFFLHIYRAGSLGSRCLASSRHRLKARFILETLRGLESNQRVVFG